MGRRNRRYRTAHVVRRLTDLRAGVVALFAADPDGSIRWGAGADTAEGARLRRKEAHLEDEAGWIDQALARKRPITVPETRPTHSDGAEVWQSRHGTTTRTRASS